MFSVCNTNRKAFLAPETLTRGFLTANFSLPISTAGASSGEAAHQASACRNNGLHANEEAWRRKG